MASRASRRSRCRRCQELASLLEALIKRYRGDAGEECWQKCKEVQEAEKALRSFKRRSA